MKLGWSVPARVGRWAASAVITVAAVRALAGRWDVPWIWATVGVASVLGLAVTLVIDPELVRERRRPGPVASIGSRGRWSACAWERSW